MTGQSDAPVLAAELAGFETAGFGLQEDLAELQRVQGAGARSGVILYCGRILEALCGEALRRAGLRVRPNLASNLELLRQLNLAPPATLRWAHCVRRTANDARHLRRRLASEDAEMSTAFVERWLAWYFCEYRYGPGVVSLTQAGGPLGLATGRELAAAITLLDSEGAGLTALAERITAANDDPLQHSPVFAAIVAEGLLDQHGAGAQVARVLAAGLARCPQDLRLRQLDALHASRKGDLEPAREALERLLREAPDDEESLGMLGGVYKRLHEAEGEERWLQAARRSYRRGWERSRGANPYLGLNAATTALWLARVDEARELAAEVVAELEERGAALAARDAAAGQLGYWDRVTRAEAALLLGRWDEARQAYASAFADHAERREAIQLTRRQALRILAHDVAGQGAPDVLRQELEPA